jgi:hypothetical protein
MRGGAHRQADWRPPRPACRPLTSWGGARRPARTRAPPCSRCGAAWWTACAAQRRPWRWRCSQATPSANDGGCRLQAREGRARLRQRFGDASAPGQLNMAAGRMSLRTWRPPPSPAHAHAALGQDKPLTECSTMLAARWGGTNSSRSPSSMAAECVRRADPIGRGMDRATLAAARAARTGAGTGMSHAVDGAPAGAPRGAPLWAQRAKCCAPCCVAAVPRGEVGEGGLRTGGAGGAAQGQWVVGGKGA